MPAMTERPAAAKDPIVLAIDTATPQVSVALAGPAGPIAALAVAGGRRHGELLVPAIDTLCQMSETSLAHVSVIAVDVGPGLFTGLRVGVSTARALVSALGVRGLGLTSLEILAGAHHRESRSVVAVIDARRGEVFWARFRPGPDGLRPTAPAAVASPAALAAALAEATPGAWAERGEPALVVGDGALRYGEALAGVPGVVLGGPDDAHPSAAVAARLAAARLSSLIRTDWAPCPEGGGSDGLEPLYLREPDVRIGWASRAPVPARPPRGGDG